MTTTPPTARFTTPANASSATDYGFDVICLPDLDPTLTPRNDRAIVADALAQRFNTRRGQLPFYPNYGLLLTDYLEDEVTFGLLEQLKADVEGQAEQEERVENAIASAEYNPTTSTLKVRLDVQVADGPFALVFGVTELSIDLLTEGV